MPVTSTVCLIAKNESQYLVEWIAYNRILGFNEIVVYENNSDDNSAEILSKLASAGQVTHRTWKLGKNESPQITAYKDAIKRCRTDWILFIDADEFLVLHKHKHVNDFLEPFHQDPSITAVGINWRIFGDSGHLTNDGRPVLQRFTRAAERSFPVNAHLKSFSRVKALGSLIHMHMCETSGRIVHASGHELTMPSWGLSKDIDFEHAQINHYYNKTPEEYQIKKKRGQGGAGDDKPDLKYWYSDHSYQAHNRNDIEDLTILERFTEVEAEMTSMNDILARATSTVAPRAGQWSRV